MRSMKKGFTLIEILLVIGLIAILASIVIVAINPARQYQQARDANRWADVNTILNAVHQYSVDNNGTLPSGITGSATEICRTGVSASTCSSSGLADLSVLTNSGLYLISIPIDPSCVGDDGSCDTNGTGYLIEFNTNGRVQVTADGAEVTTPIEVIR